MIKMLFAVLLLTGYCASLSAVANTKANNTLSPAEQLHMAELEYKAMRHFLKNSINKADSFKDRFDAEVWLVDMSGRLERYIKDPEERLHILTTVHREATRAKLKPDLVLALMQVESAFDQYAISSAGAQGLMQVMPFWKDEIGRPDDNLTNVETNIRYGCTILQYYMEREKWKWSPALARYNGSVGKTWYPERVFNAWHRYWKIQ